MCKNVGPSVRLCVRTYIRDPVRLRIRHLYQVEFCSFIVRYPTAGHPCTVDTFLVFINFANQQEKFWLFGHNEMLVINNPLFMEL